MDVHVSVVIPAYRDTSELGPTLDAIARQSLRAVEVIVVNNDPATPVMPEDRGLDLRVVEVAAPGSYAARNGGLACARGQIVAFTDVGCRPRPDWLAAACAVLDAPDAPDVIAGDVHPILLDPDALTLAARYELARAFPIAEYVERYGIGVTANLVCRVGAFERFGLFDARLKSGGDAEWTQRVSDRGGSVAYGPGVVVEHPVRTSLGALVTKARRVAGGLHDRTVHEGALSSYVRGSLLRDALPPVRPSIQLMREAPSVASGLALAGIEILLNYVRLGERLRLLTGWGESTRV